MGLKQRYLCKNVVSKKKISSKDTWQSICTCYFTPLLLQEAATQHGARLTNGKCKKQRVIHHCFGETTPVHLLSSTVFFRRRLLADSATCGSVNFIISVLVSLQPNYKLVVLSFIKIKNVISFAQNVRHFPQYTCTMLLSTFTLRHSVLAHFIIYSSGLTALSTGSPWSFPPKRFTLHSTHKSLSLFL